MYRKTPHVFAFTGGSLVLVITAAGCSSVHSVMKPITTEAAAGPCTQASRQVAIAYHPTLLPCHIFIPAWTLQAEDAGHTFSSLCACFRCIPLAASLLQKKKGSKAEIAAARNKVSDAKAAVLQLKFDLEQMEAQKDLDKTIGKRSCQVLGAVAGGGGGQA
jgi:hypothetical protein